MLGILFFFKQREKNLKDTVELCAMGALKEYHRQGVGSALVLKTKEISIEKGYSFVQVKTVI